MEQTILGLYGQIVDARVTATHQAVQLKFPIFIAI
jgi:hypothetical protein